MTDQAHFSLNPESPHYPGRATLEHNELVLVQQAAYHSQRVLLRMMRNPHHRPVSYSDLFVDPMPGDGENPGVSWVGGDLQRVIVVGKVGPVYVFVYTVRNPDARFDGLVRVIIHHISATEATDAYNRPVEVIKTDFLSFYGEALGVMTVLHSRAWEAAVEPYVRVQHTRGYGVGTFAPSLRRDISRAIDGALFEAEAAIAARRRARATREAGL
jgi:hypothetical protein